MKKVLAVIFVFALLFAVVSCADEEEVVKSFYELSNEELGELYKNIDKYPENFLDDELKDKYTGLCNRSASSADEALSLVEQYYRATETRIDTETDLYYGVYVKRPSSTAGEYIDEYIVCFKKDVFDCDLYFTWHFNTSDKTAIERMINYYCYHEVICGGDGSRIIYTEMEETDDALKYNAYWGGISGGEPEIQDEVTIYKSVITIHKDTMTADVGSANGDIAVTEYGTIYLAGGSLH